MAVQRALLTARSACAAWGMVEIWKAAQRRSDLAVEVLAQEPAASIFRLENIPHTLIDLPPLTRSTGTDADTLVARTTDAVRQFRPDVALVGLSAPNEGGIDEAAILIADFPTFLLQDFWGDGNLFFGRHADCYLASDAAGAKATTERHGVPNLVLGSPRHVKYRDVDLEAARTGMLERLGLDPAGEYFGFFCQPLMRLPGYVRSVELWAETVGRITGGAVIYRPHPASDDAQVARVTAILRDRGLDPRLARGGPVESAIAASAVITSALSNTNIDAAYVNRFAREPKASAVYVLCEPDVVAYMNAYQHVDGIPVVTEGLAGVIRRPEEAEAVLRSAIDPQTRLAAWKRSRRLPDPVAAVALAVDILLRPQDFLKPAAMAG